MNGLVKERGGGPRRGKPPTGRWREWMSRGIPSGMFPKNAERSKPLMYAASKGDTVVARLLIEKGADLKRKNKKDKTALEIADDTDHMPLSRC